MKKTYIIKGGGQRVRQCYHSNQVIEIEERLTNHEEQAKCYGQDHFANDLWSGDLGTTKKMARGWVPGKLKFTVKK